jgi:hypothetical protein
MALIDCPDCSKQVSSAAVSCPKCGYPIGQEVQRAVLGPEAETPEEWKTLGESVHDPKPMADRRRGPRKQTNMRNTVLAATMFLLVVVMATFDRSERDAVEPVTTVEPGSQSREGSSAKPLDVPEAPDATAASAGAQGSVTNPAHTLGKGRATVQRMCKGDDGAWIDGMCMLSNNMAVMFEWRNGRVMEHTILKEDTSFGHSMVREFRKLGGKEDSTVAADGCDEYIWRNIGGRRYWVIICPSKGIATASARLL